MKAQDLVKRMRSASSPTVVDVRSGAEYENGHIPGAINAPSWKIMLRIARLPEDKSSELVVTCEHGPRAQMAQGLLHACGYRNTALLEGHMSGWRSAGLPLEKQAFPPLPPEASRQHKSSNRAPL